MCWEVIRFKDMKVLFTLLLAGVTAVVFAQQYGRPVRFKIYHADPWTVKALLEGQALLSPEMSTLLTSLGAPPQAGNTLNGLFKDGKFVINAADNSLYWFPEIKK